MPFQGREAVWGGYVCTVNAAGAQSAAQNAGLAENTPPGKSVDLPGGVFRALCARVYHLDQTILVLVA
jgi:hypothetical protein